MLWLWLFNSKLGLINFVLRSIGVGDPPGWLTDVRFALPALVLMSFWGVGNTVVIFLAGLQDVPRDLYEAAELDGAGKMRSLWHVTLPSISPVIFFNLIIGIIGTLQVFTLPYIMTQGGPARATYFYTMYLYDNVFQYLKVGYASAMAWIQLLMILALTGLAFWSSRRWVHYQGSQT
jgi:multiple sugar transport system permease protein